MYHFCTLFDSSYLHKGLALYESLLNQSIDFHLYVVAFDQDCYYKLQDFALKNLTVVSLHEFESPELLAVKPSRNRAEYCWTSGPSVIHYFMTNFHLDHCTYVDADLMFFNSPKPVFDEIGDSSVALTEHFTEEIDELGGRFCVQFVYFKNDTEGMKALNWWKDQCINWCFARFEDGKFGDQKYLDYFPDYFKNVHVVKHRGVGVAPWNIEYYEYPESGKVKHKGKEYPVIFFHFHGTKIDYADQVLSLKLITVDIPKQAVQTIFIPYLHLLQKVYSRYFGVMPEQIHVIKRHPLKSVYSRLKKMLRHNKLMQFIYFKVFKVRYNGYEK